MMFLILLVRDCLFQAILDVMPCSPAIHARSGFDLHHICGRTLAFCGVCSRVYARQTLRIGALRCLPAIYKSDRSSIRQLGVLQLASAFGVCLGAQKQSLRFVLSGF
jgi:hypothetical protein